MKLVHRKERDRLDNSKQSGLFIDPNGVFHVDNLLTAIATSDGLTTGILLGADQFVTVTSAASANIVTLPQASLLRVGTIIEGVVGANGFKLQVNTNDATTVTLNGVTTNVKAVIPASVSFKVKLISPTAWILTTLTALGAVGTAIVPA